MRTPQTLARISEHPKYRRQRAPGRRQRITRAVHATLLELYPTGYFRREDVLRLPIWRNFGLATSTLLQYVYSIVTELVVNQQLVEITHTELCVQGAQHKILMEPLTETYGRTIQRLVERRMDAAKAPFGVYDIVDTWISDPQLSRNTKEVAVREMLKKLSRGSDAILKLNEDFTYTGA